MFAPRTRFLSTQPSNKSDTMAERGTGASEGRGRVFNFSWEKPWYGKEPDSISFQLHMKILKKSFVESATMWASSTLGNTQNDFY